MLSAACVGGSGTYGTYRWNKQQSADRKTKVVLDYPQPSNGNPPPPNRNANEYASQRTIMTFGQNATTSGGRSRNQSSKHDDMVPVAPLTAGALLAAI